MNRSASKESPNVSLSSSNGIGRISSSGTTLMNGSGQLLYRRSPIPTQISLQPQSFDTLGSPSTTSYNSEEISENINSFEGEDITDLNQKLDTLQRQIEALTLTQTTQDERYRRSRQENDALLDRVHGLEDQIRELELGSEARAKEDEKRFKETMAKQMKVQSQECEQHLHANFLLQQEQFQLKNDLLKCEALVKTLRSEKEALELELQEKNSELVNLDEEVHKLKLLVKNLKDEENLKSNLISILNEELEDSHNRSQREQSNDQLIASSSSHGNSNQSPRQRSIPSRRSSVASGPGDEYLSTNVNHRVLKDIDGLEASLNKLRDDNRRLREMNEELQAQLLCAQIEEGRSLVQEGDRSYSLADEMGDIDVTKLLKDYNRVKDDNVRMKKYIDKMTLRIVTTQPALLEKE